MFRPVCLLFLLAMLPLPADAQRLSALAPRPDWSELDAFQETITRDQFERLLDRVYAPDDAWRATIAINEENAEIVTRKGQPPYVLRFAATPADARAVPSYWRPRAALGPAPKDQPLEGLRIAIDPGHIGGPWAKLEERWFRIGTSKPVTEGDMTLLVAKLLAVRLKALGARVYLTRSDAEPITRERPEGLLEEARDSLGDRGVSPSSRSLEWESRKLFYRISEIRERARLVNERIKPDLTICLHFNAEAWGDPARPTLTNKNHMHFLVTGAFSELELSYEDQRFTMLLKLLGRAYSEELAVTESIATAMAEETNLPPFVYHGSNAVKTGSNPYVWGRNLLANRLFQCPVVYAEPYVMNSREVFARVQAGDYSGRRNFGGVARKSIYREYVDGIVNGLVAYYRQR